jgi:heptosyltransferase-2
MKKILIIKTGAAGDIVRTTVLLQVLQGAITWVIDEKYRELLPLTHPRLIRIIPWQIAREVLQEEEFDLTLSLEEDRQCAQLATRIRSLKIVGVFLADHRITYSSDSSGWYDMSLLSVKGSSEANRLKLQNRFSFQELLFEMIGLPFRGEPYCIYRNSQVRTQTDRIGIEKRSGNRWPNKYWNGYDELSEGLSAKGYTIRILRPMDSLKDYLDEIAACNYIVSGDTLGMHIALAYQKPCVAIFNCTSPEEIYDYGILKKVISPLLRSVFYHTGFSEAAVSAVRVEEVLEAFQSLSAPK